MTGVQTCALPIWYYTVVQLPSEFRTTYDVAEWNYLYAGSDYGAGKKPNGYNSYSPNNYDELTNTRDWGELFAHMPASSQNVTAKAYFADGATPMGALAAGALKDTEAAYFRYYGAGWRFALTNYANPK